jgi:acetyl-CoA acetyltransferase family protein
MVSTTLGWRLVNPKMPAEWTVSLGECNEMLAAREGVSRRRQDEFAALSHHRTQQAWDDGFYGRMIVEVPGVSLARDETIRPGTTADTLAELRTAFRSVDQGGTITAGNASPLNDGASALMLGSADAAISLGRDPLARIAGRGTHANDPRDFGAAPIQAANKALQRAGMTWADVDAVELNEAFAAQSLVCVDAWKVDPAIVNARGGAIAIGHPLGASGGRVLGTVAHRLAESGGRWGVATLCIGVGQALAVVVENVTSKSADTASVTEREGSR